MKQKNKKFGKLEETAARRDFITRELKTKKIISYAEIEKESERREKLLNEAGSDFFEVTFPVSYQSIVLDVREISRSHGIAVRTKKQGGRLVLYSPGNQSLTTKELRRMIDPERKRAISYLLGGILLGQSTGKAEAFLSKSVFSANDDLVDPNHIFRVIESWQHIHPMVAGWREKSEFLIKELPRYWSTIARRIVIDNGSTIDSLAEEVLAHASFKSTADLLSSFEVCTNSRTVYNVLGDPNVHVRAMIIGGFQEGGAEAICGHLAETFLEMSNLTFSIAVIGATVVDLDKGQFGSDHYRDGLIKQKFLDRSHLRIIAVDSGKFAFNPLNRYNPFCSINPQCVDLIVTDSYAGLAKSLGMKGGLKDSEIVSALSRICAVPILEAGEALLMKMKGASPNGYD